jgi:hypothetical protein
MKAERRRVAGFIWISGGAEWVEFSDCNLRSASCSKAQAISDLGPEIGRSKKEAETAI